MLISTLTLENGRKLLVLGLEEENIRLLLEDKPIYKVLGENPIVPNLEEWDVTILGPEDTFRWIAQYKEHNEPTASSD